jgi:uncharacterized Fe-S cluster-containing radical SAM superfamily protein
MVNVLIYLKPINQKFFLDSNDHLYFVDRKLVKVLDKNHATVKVEVNNNIRFLPPNSFSEMVGFVTEPNWDEDGRFLKIENSSVPFIDDMFDKLAVSLPTNFNTAIKYRLEFNEDTQKLRIPQEIYFCNEPRFRNLLRKGL